VVNYFVVIDLLALFQCSALQLLKLQNWLLSAGVIGGIGNNLFAHVPHKYIPVSLSNGKIFLGKFQIHRIFVDHTQAWDGDDEGFVDAGSGKIGTGHLT
jgi:hypothetical protein